MFLPQEGAKGDVAKTPILLFISGTADASVESRAYVYSPTLVLLFGPICENIGGRKKTQEGAKDHLRIMRASTVVLCIVTRRAPGFRKIVPNIFSQMQYK